MSNNDPPQNSETNPPKTKHLKQTHYFETHKQDKNKEGKKNINLQAKNERIKETHKIKRSE